jgi:hypothetical protein
MFGQKKNRSSITPSTSTQQEEQISTLVEQGKKAIALQEWEKAIDKYADALEMT